MSESRSPVHLSKAPDLESLYSSSPPSKITLSDDQDIYEATVEEDLAELDYLQGQLKELKYLIREKRRTIAQRTGQEGPSIVECDSLKCVAKTIEGKARKAAHNVIGKVIGVPEEEESLDFPKPHWPKLPFHRGKPGNHTCGPPKHGKGNHTFPHPPPKHGKGNHTHPPPHFKKPHLHLPFCHYPPPHRKPHHGKPPPHRKPPVHHKPPHKPLHQGPLEEQADDKSSLPSFDRKPSQGIFLPFEVVEEAAPAEQTPREVLQGQQLHKLHLKAFHIFSLGLVVFLVSLIIKVVHRRLSTPLQAAARQTRRAERHHRRSLRRAALRESIHNLLTRLLARAPSQQDEEKRAAALADSSPSTTMTDDIAGFMNAADMVSEIVAAEEGRARRSMFLEGEGESLPAYEGHDDSELGNVADGCRYTPGSSDYTPSLAGSASDILGVDVKQ